MAPFRIGGVEMHKGDLPYRDVLIVIVNDYFFSLSEDHSLRCRVFRMMERGITCSKRINLIKPKSPERLMGW